MKITTYTRPPADQRPVTDLPPGYSATTGMDAATGRWVFELRRDGEIVDYSLNDAEQAESTAQYVARQSAWADFGRMSLA